MSDTLRKRTVGIYFDLPGTYDFPLSKPRFFRAFFDYSMLLKKYNIETYIVRDYKNNYVGEGVFKKAWSFSDPLTIRQIDDEVHIDLLIEREDHRVIDIQDIPIINHRSLAVLCDDKAKTRDVFGHLMPKSVQVAAHQDLAFALQRLGTSTKVFKPVLGFGGQGIIISDDDEEIIKTATTAEYPALVQEYVDSSKGIAGIVDGLHDFRLIVVDGEVVMAHVRQPAEGSLLSNTALGGKLTPVDLPAVPLGARTLFEEIDAYFKQYGHRFYSVDMMFDGYGKPYLIELNARPALNRMASSSGAARYIAALAEMTQKALSVQVFS